MPRRTDLHSVLVIGSGPIVIGQAAEFDYSGTQALRVLKDEGIRVILVNSNPATIMTDPEFADATYIEPITPETVEKIIAKERPDAILPTLGGQTALNTAIALDERGALERYGVELIGANIAAINLGEDREAFKGVVERCGAESARSEIVHSMDEALAAAERLGYPMVVRPSFTMGGLGSGMAYDEVDLHRIAGAGIQYSPTSEVLLEESILGWKEYELEMMRDRNDNVVVVCSIENFDPVGVHTGDSITVAPALTLTDREYQKMRDVAIAVIREVGVDTGGCNIQFAVDPATGRVVVIEMNPRVSRSSALASKATGFPIAKIATKLSLGYTLDEIPNDITRKTPASFEPTLDYVVVKVPRFAFEKFPAADPTLTTTMKSVGEAMALGRSFTEALQKAMRSLEQKDGAFDFAAETPDRDALDELVEATRTPTTQRIHQVRRALAAGAGVERMYEATGIDPWFLDQLQLLNEVAERVRADPDLTPDTLREAKRHGFSDAQIAAIAHTREDVVRGVRHALGIRPVFKTVDTCAAEFEAFTPYHYSAYDQEDEVAPHEGESIMILGSGPNRIGQGIEFDYSCVHASMVLREAGYETVMVNCNPETVSTDYDVSTRLYFEPLTLEDVLEVIEEERRTGGLKGVYVQLGGQTPLKLAAQLQEAGVPILGTTPEAIDLAEDRGEFAQVLERAGLISPKNGTASTFAEAKRIADGIGYPVLVRPSYVLGGRGMEIVYDEASLAAYLEHATEVSPSQPALIDKFLEDAIEIDVDALFDGTDLYMGGVMEHIEEAGIHSGDSACTLPPVTLGPDVIDRVCAATRGIAEGSGCAADQHPVRGGLGHPLRHRGQSARLAHRALRLQGHRGAAGQGRRADRGGPEHPRADRAGRAALAHGRGPHPGGHGDRRQGGRAALQPLPHPRGRGGGRAAVPRDALHRRGHGPGPLLRHRLRQGQAAVGSPLPTEGRVFVSVANRDKRSAVVYVKMLQDLGFEIVTTGGTAQVLRRNGIPCTVVPKLGDVAEGERSVVDMIREGQIDLIFNTPSGGSARGDGYEIRAAATSVGVPLMTTLSQFGASIQSIAAQREHSWDVLSLQEHEATLAQRAQQAPAAEGDRA
ncbi:Carbamoyl-phosphate synthase large chain [Rothia kristinae]|nr:Carbamoyl-phosphate synthase large chain [Rothia kristinae]